MTERTVRVRLEVDAGTARRDVKAFSGDLKELGGVVKSSGEHATAAGNGIRDLGVESSRAKGHVGGLSGALEKIGMGGGIGGLLGGLAAVDVVKRIVGSASDLNETVSKTRAVFGSASKGVEEWANNAADSMGMSKRAALDGASSFENLFHQIGLSGDASAKMSTNLVKLSSDFASFHNADPAEVMDALLSATRGEYDALQRFVPTVNAAAIQTRAMADSGKASATALTDAEKATALYEIVTEGAGAAAGDFARTSGGAANQQRILKANLEDTAATIGNAVLPVYGGMLQAVNALGPATIAAAAGVALLSNRFAASKADSEGLVNTLGAKFTANIEAADASGAKFGTTLGVMKTAGQGLKAAGAGIVGLFGGPWGLALTAATIGVGMLVQKHQEEEAANKAVIDSGRELVNTYRDQGQAAGDAAFKKQLQSKDFAKEYNQVRELGAATNDLAAAYGGSASAQGRVLDVLRARSAINSQEVADIQAQADAENRGLNPAEIERYHALVASNTEIRTNIGSLKEQWHGTVDVKTATDDYTASTKTLSAADEDLYKKLESVRTSTVDTATAADILKSAQDRLFGIVQNQNEATETYNSNLLTLKQSIQENGNAFDNTTAAGLRNRDALERQLKASVDLYEADIAAKVPQEQATQRHQDRINKLLGEIQVTGKNRDEVHSLVDMYGTVPSVVDTQLRVLGFEDANGKLSAIGQRAKELVQQFGIDPKLAASIAGSGLSQNKPHPRAAGGPVFGPGGPTDDMIPAVGPGGQPYLLSNGEHVVTAKEVAAAGGHAGMVKLRKSLLATGRADGGPVIGIDYPINLPEWGPYKDFKAKMEGLVENLSSLGNSSYQGAIPGNVSGNLMGWIAAAMQITGVPGYWADRLRVGIMRESGGNPNAINRWDSNAAAGHPSQGLMQTIPGTFAAYRDPRLPNSITDPVANIVAGINYIKSRYGDILNVQQFNPNASPRGYAGGGPVGHVRTAVYDQGGPLEPGWTAAYNGTGKTEWVSTSGASSATAGASIAVTINAGMGANGYQIGQQVADALRNFVERNGGNVQQVVVGRQV